jgi:hypothetical protein
MLLCIFSWLDQEPKIKWSATLIQPSRKVRKCYYPVAEGHADEALVKSLYQRIEKLETDIFRKSTPDHVQYPIPRQWYFSALLSYS